MIVKSIEVQNLYGYMDKYIEFNDDINLLVGINGSGKTSILNLVNWMLIPSFPNLCTIEFQKVELKIEYKKQLYSIISSQNENEIEIKVINQTKQYHYPEIKTEFSIHPSNITKNNQLKLHLSESYQNLQPEDHEVECWDFLFSKLVNPVVIGLDRTLYTEEGDNKEYVEEPFSTNYYQRKNTNNSPLKKVIHLSSNEYQKFKNRIIDLNKRLNNKLLLASFDETLTEDNVSEFFESPRITLKEVEKLEEKVKEYFQENIIEKSKGNKKVKQKQDSALEKIERYFNNLKTILNQEKNRDKDVINILYITNVNQFRKIKDLIKEFQMFETQSNNFYQPLKNYLDSINNFLKDSAKELYFDKRTSKLKFRIFDKKGISKEENRDIETLSSGEKQILILFTYITFNDQLGKLFIIDEPELSLHPKWQESFVDGIKKIMPQNTQVLFATHSPSIVGKNKEYCKILLPY